VFGLVRNVSWKSIALIIPVEEGIVIFAAFKSVVVQQMRIWLFIGDIALYSGWE
jgi:hypothetical protein